MEPAAPLGAVSREAGRSSVRRRALAGFRPAELLLIAVLIAVMGGAAYLLVHPGALEAVAGLPPAGTITPPGQGGPARPEAVYSPLGR